METEFMGYKVTGHCRPNIKRRHNIRDPKIVQSEEHIDPNRPHETILDLGTIQEAYDKIFGEAVKEYNATQKRKDRKIGNYLAQILSDRRQGKHKNAKTDGSRKAAYEMVLQIGNAENYPDHDKTIAVLKEFCEEIPKRYQNIVPIGIYLHDDEFSVDGKTKEKLISPPHIHYDFVYVAHRGKSLKSGMKLQSSMSGALSEMGFYTRKGKGTAQTQFEEQLRCDLQDFAEQRGFVIDRSPGEKHSHMEKSVYQQKKENEKERKRLEANANELFKREESVAKGEETILEKKKSFDKQKKILEMREKEVRKEKEESEAKLSKAQNLEKQNAKKSLELANLQNDIERDKKMFEETRLKVEKFEQIRQDVSKNGENVEKEIKKFQENNSVPLEKRFNSFVTNIRKIVTAVSTELGFYKAAFKKFWLKKASEFRNLADEMERNHCETFSVYNKKLQNGELDYQLRKKERIQQRHSEKKREISSSMTR